MSLAGAIPKAAAIAIADLLDTCAQIQPGQNVVIVGAVDGLHGGMNLVDEQTLAWIQTGVQARGANATIVWADMPVRPALILGSGTSGPQGWRVPPVVRAAIAAADVFINHCVDLSFEEELKEVREICAEGDVPMVRNMATTAPLLASNWALTPYELVSEIRFQTASLLQAGQRWILTHTNGTHLEGTVAEPAGVGRYASRRTEGLYRPWPEGVFPGLVSHDSEGEVVFEGTNPIWARHIGIPSRFESPIHADIRGGHVREFRGGADAETISRCYKAIAEHLGEAAYEVRGVHGGVHPFAQVEEHQCPDPAYRDFIDHHHWSSQHVHLGNSQKSKDFGFNMHVTAEVRGATLKVGDNFVWNDGRLSALDHPEVKRVAAKYPDRPGLDPKAW